MNLTIPSSVASIRGCLNVLFILSALLLASSASARDEGGVTPKVFPSDSACKVFQAAGHHRSRLPAPFSGRPDQAC